MSTAFVKLTEPSWSTALRSAAPAFDVAMAAGYLLGLQLRRKYALRRQVAGRPAGGAARRDSPLEASPFGRCTHTDAATRIAVAVLDVLAACVGPVVLSSMYSSSGILWFGSGGICLQNRPIPHIQARWLTASGVAVPVSRIMTLRMSAVAIIVAAARFDASSPAGLHDATVVWVPPSVVTTRS